MRTTAMTAQMIVRITGVIQIVLGVLFWTGNALSLIPVHMISGIILVLALWVLAYLAIMSGVNTGLGILAIIWGLIVVGLGMTQAQLVPGPLHWVIQVVHLLVGLGAIGQAERLGRSLTQRGPTVIRA